jgi:hypothetical protein
MIVPTGAGTPPMVRVPLYVQGIGGMAETLETRRRRNKKMSGLLFMAPSRW